MICLINLRHYLLKAQAGLSKTKSSYLNEKISFITKMVNIIKTKYFPTKFSTTTL